MLKINLIVFLCRSLISRFDPVWTLLELIFVYDEDNLNNIAYISVDCGAEKGMSQETTFVEVNNYLTSRNFEIVAINEKRLVCLYKNKNDWLQ